MEFKKRTTSPSGTDKNYIHYTAGGYNYCIKITGNSVLPNCVGYCWGRWREILGAYHNLSRGNAENWYGNTADGYKRGKTPKLGAVICWRGGQVGNVNDGAGHVAIVEEIHDDYIVISQSNYKGTRWELLNCYKDANGNYKARSSSNIFQGFIYLPVEYEESASNDTKTASNEAKSSKTALEYTETELENALNTVAGYVISGKFGNGEQRRENIYNAVQNRANKLLANLNLKSNVPLEAALILIAKAVIKGVYGNGEARKTALYQAVQRKVNERYKK